jgi:hypothetical protein
MRGDVEVDDSILLLREALGNTLSWMFVLFLPAKVTTFADMKKTSNDEPEGKVQIFRHRHEARSERLERFSFQSAIR